VFSEFLVLDLSGLTLGGIYLEETCVSTNSMTLPVKNTYQSCLRTATHAIVWPIMQMAIWPNKGVRTLRDTRLAVGRFLLSIGYGPDQPTVEGLASDRE
jgi:hypothetical protein